MKAGLFYRKSYVHGSITMPLEERRQAAGSRQQESDQG
jgi:hypothetical protein